MKKITVAFIVIVFLFSCSLTTEDENSSNKIKDGLEEVLDQEQEKNEFDKVQEMLDNDKIKLDSMKKAMDVINEEES